MSVLKETIKISKKFFRGSFCLNLSIFLIEFERNGHSREGSCHGKGSEERSCNTEPCDKLEIQPRARTEISACPSDECWRYNFALGKCEAVETCTRIVCGSESINIIFDKNLFGYANAQDYGFTKEKNNKNVNMNFRIKMQNKRLLNNLHL